MFAGMRTYFSAIPKPDQALNDRRRVVWGVICVLR